MTREQEILSTMNRSNPIILRRAARLGMLLASAAALTSSSAAQSAVAVDPVPSRRSTLSDIDFIVTGNGRFGYDSAKAHNGFISPRGSERAYLFGSGLWFGAMRPHPEGARPLVFSTYNPNTGWSNAAPGDTGGPGLPLVFHNVDYDQLGNPIVPAVQPWPLWLVEPVDTVKMMYPGVYVADTAQRRPEEFPGGASFALLAQEQMVTRYHDRDLGLYEDGPEVAAQEGYPLGLQIQQNVYSWNLDPFRNAVIVQYQIVNVSSDTLHGCVIGHVTDPDIGAGENDHVTRTTLDPTRRTIFGWSDPDLGDAEYGTLATMLVEAPLVGSDGYIRGFARELFRQQGRMTVFSRWISDDGIATTKDRYDAMTVPDWSPDTDSGAADLRMVIASDTFSFRPGDTAYFAVAYAVFQEKLGKQAGSISLGGGGQSEAPGLSSVDFFEFRQELYDTYYNFSDWHPALVESDRSAESAELSVIPNPAGDRAALRFSLAEQEQVTVRLVDRLGRQVLEHDLGVMAAGGHVHPLDLSRLAPGIYLASVESGAARQVVPLTVVR